MVLNAAPFALSLRVIASGLFLALLASCRNDAPDSNEPVAANSARNEGPGEPVALDRRAILLAVGEAASAAASGADDTAAQAALAGRQFQFRIPFGCPADASLLDRSLKLVVRPDGKAYEASAAPDVALADVEPVLRPTGAPAAAPGGASEATAAQSPAPPAAIEAAEGFWIARPWQLDGRCPAVPAAAPAPTNDTGVKVRADETTAQPPQAGPEPVRPTVALVHYYAAGESRLGYRDGKPLTKVQTIGAGRPAPTAGAVMVLHGRLRQWPGGNVIRCRADEADRSPRCFVSATIDRIAFERIDDAAPIAEWTR